VPSGLLKGSDRLEIRAQLYVDSKASWDEVLGPGQQYSSTPDLRELIRILHGGVIAKA
jgi:hypothetical protein